jgi:hypothetical protein
MVPQHHNLKSQALINVVTCQYHKQQELHNYTQSKNPNQENNPKNRITLIDHQEINKPQHNLQFKVVKKP